MASPVFKLYQSDGVTLQYTFTYVINVNPFPWEEQDYIEHDGIRGQGSLIIDGGQKPYNITITGFLSASDYEALTVLIYAMKTAIVMNTSYVFKLDKGDGSTEDLNVKRIIGIEFPIEGDTSASKRNKKQKYEVTFRVDSWA